MKLSVVVPVELVCVEFNVVGAFTISVEAQSLASALLFVVFSIVSFLVSLEVELILIVCPLITIEPV